VLRFYSSDCMAERLCCDYNGGVMEEGVMARYGKAAGKSVESAVRREKKGTLKSGKGGKGGKVKSRKQAIAIGLSEARKKGAKVPRKKSS
jgi:hypothetical protein